MHELAITQSVVDAVISEVDGRRVECVTLVIGKLSGVVADSVRFAFDVCTPGTPLEGARLDIVETPALAHCRSCECDVELPDMLPLCTCGSAEVDIIGGRELAIRSVEVEV